MHALSTGAERLLAFAFEGQKKMGPSRKKKMDMSVNKSRPSTRDPGPPSRLTCRFRSGEMSTGVFGFT